MKRLDSSINQKKIWKETIDNAQQRIEVDINEVERVIELARRTPGLAKYENELQKLSIFFRFSTLFYQDFWPEGLTKLVDFWERYRATVIQRYSSITPVELRAADKVVKDIFEKFLKGIPPENYAYSEPAVPLVYGGKGGLGAYSTNPPEWNRPFAIINLPHTAFDNVWCWLALGHEIGHDTYATVDGLKEEVENALGDRMKKAVRDGEIKLSPITIDLTPFNVPYQKQYSGEEFIEIVWRCWAEEAQSDIVGLLACGGASIIALQQIIEFSEKGSWISDTPEEHPIAYVRNAMNIAALRLMSNDHEKLADEIKERFLSLRPKTEHITWYLNERNLVAEVPVKEMEKSAEIAAEVLLNHNLNCLDKHCYKDLLTFTGKDQKIVDEMTEELIRGYPTFAQCKTKKATPRHALAATMFAFEKDRSKAEVINRTFKHFV